MSVINNSMDELTMETLTAKFNQFVIDCELKPSNRNSGSARIIVDEASSDLGNMSQQVNEDTLTSYDTIQSNATSEISPDMDHTLPVLKKIQKLSSEIRELKNRHVALSDHVKITTDSFPDLDIVKSVQGLGAEYEILKRKYLEEFTERRRLYNEVIEMKGNIRVFCRCRPLNESEIANGHASVLNFESSSDNELQVICSDSSKKQFRFDSVFRPDDNQEAVFAQTKPIVTSVLDGFNVCIFAYGQTGTGKTFTMEGTQENRGVNYRTLDELFRISEERHKVMKYELVVSMLEVYNEKIRDLLADNSDQPTKKLEVKQASDGTQEVPGLVEARVYGIKDVWEILKSGNRTRSVGSTNANELSSRSHCLLRVTVMGENLINGQRTRSHLWLVDLAGSERVGKTEAEGDRLKESQFINKSLSALGDVISALASKSAHVPYRNSKLTHILQSSLGGDCKTLMFVQISPSSADLGETICSLNFATRVRGIESGPARKQVDLTELFKYKQMAEKLKHDEKETKKLQDSLQSLQLRLAAREHMCRNLQEKVRDLENQIADERKTRLRQESRAIAMSNQPSKLASLKEEPTRRPLAEKRPPLNPSKLRVPLRRLTTNIFPQPSPMPSKKNGYYHNGKENTSRKSMMMRNSGDLVKPRRASFAVRPQSGAAPSTSQVFQPRRRVSIASFRSDTNSDLSTPLRGPSCGFGSNQSSIRSQRKARYSRLFAPLPEMRTSVETTPSIMRSSSKFMGSPIGRNPAVVALGRKSFVWSPLKLRNLKNSRKASLLPPSRPSSEMQ